MKAIFSKTIEKPCGFLFARWSAGAKAFEDSLPDEQRVISDPLARYYAGQAGMNMVGTMQAINPNIRKAIVLRARYIDDHARQCVREGYDQVVLLGAGYDSRYVRLPEFRRATVFEMDLPSTQVIKKALTRRLYGKLPDNVVYVTIDFSKDAVTEKLMNAGFQRHRKTLFIWEGVTLFLNQDILEETLGRLVGLGRDNRVVFDFVPPELIDDETDYMGNQQLLRLCANVQEPLTFGCRPDRMKGILQGLGFSNVNIVSMRQANMIYAGSDDIEDSYFFATAEVKSFDGEHDRLVNAGGLIISGGDPGAHSLCA